MVQVVKIKATIYKCIHCDRKCIVFKDVEPNLLGYKKKPMTCDILESSHLTSLVMVEEFIIEHTMENDEDTADIKFDYNDLDDGQLNWIDDHASDLKEFGVPDKYLPPGKKVDGDDGTW